MDQSSVAIAEPLSKYKRTEIETAPPLKLLLMLYDAAIQRCESAVESIRAGKSELAHRCLIKAQDILTELIVSLDTDAESGPVGHLFALYEYMHQQLIRANIKKETGPIEEVGRLLTELREAWSQAGAGLDDQETPPPPPSSSTRIDIQS